MSILVTIQLNVLVRQDRRRTFAADLQPVLACCTHIEVGVTHPRLQDSAMLGVIGPFRLVSLSWLDGLITPLFQLFRVLEFLFFFSLHVAKIGVIKPLRLVCKSKQTCKSKNDDEHGRNVLKIFVLTCKSGPCKTKNPPEGGSHVFKDRRIQCLAAAP